LPRFLRQSPEPFGLVPKRLGCSALFFRGLASALGVLPAVLRLLAYAFCLLTVVLGWDLLIRHGCLSVETAMRLVVQDDAEQ
jgi:hypothetical protein